MSEQRLVGIVSFGKYSIKIQLFSLIITTMHSINQMVGFLTFKYVYYFQVLDVDVEISPVFIQVFSTTANGLNKQ